jgi:hypothetical protein
VLREVRKWVDKKAVVVITGMRQVGKTTLCRMLFSEIASKNKAFIDLENPLNRRAFQENDYDNIWANLAVYGIKKDRRSYIFLDEIQAMPGIVKPIKYLFDNYDVQFFLTGSSSFYLKNIFPESLAGRKVVFELFPLDFEEFLWFKGAGRDFGRDFAAKERMKNRVMFEKTIKLYEEYISYGGFPKVVLAGTAEEKQKLIEDIYTSYFEKDVRSLADFRDISKLQEIILLLFQRSGSKLNVSRISSELGISRETVYSYLSFLEATYFISLVPPFSRSADREVSAAKKVYICDTGILNRVARVSSGALFENAVFNVLKAGREVRYYQRRTGVEIDFVLKKEGIALEVKERGTAHDMKRLENLSGRIGINESYVITKAFSADKGFIPATNL